MTDTHFILYVEDQHASARFYSRVLDLTPFLDVPGMTEFRLTDHSILGLMPIDGARRLLGPGTFPDTTAGRNPKAELYLNVACPERYHDRALELGARELSPMQDRDWGDRAAYSIDPDGHVLAFAARIDKAPAD